VQVKNYF